MKITMILPALGLHQLALSNDLYNALGNGFTFIATEKITSGRFGFNYDEMATQYSYVIKAYDSNEAFGKAKSVIADSDVLIIGSSPNCYTDFVYNNSKALVLRYSERLFKNGTIRRFIPSVRRKIKNQFQFNRKNLAVLCASGYLPYDLSFFSKNITTLKWGYFPENKILNNIERKSVNDDIVKILWAGRMVKFKRPMDAIEMVKRLKSQGVSFELSFIGSGEMLGQINKEIYDNKLDKNIVVKGEMNTEDLFSEMCASDIFLFTSSFGEGWGAILNEAMNAGCACVCSHAPGSVPFVVEDGKNGIIYHNGNINELCEKVKMLIDNPYLRKTIGKEAYRTVTEYWNHREASARLIDLVQHYIYTGEIKAYDSGILSEAQVIKNNWHKD